LDVSTRQYSSIAVVVSDASESLESVERTSKRYYIGPVHRSSQTVPVGQRTVVG